MAVAAALLAWFKFLRLSLAPSLLMTAVAGYLLFRIGASGASPLLYSLTLLGLGT